MTSDTDRDAPGEHATANPTPHPEPSSQAAVPPPAPATAGAYEVRPGDSLWSIARQRLGTASAAETARFVDRLWSLNANVIRSGSPDVIVTGEKLRLPQTR